MVENQTDSKLSNETFQEQYLAFLKSKIPQAEQTGFTPKSNHAKELKPHQRDIAGWMMQGGRRACFANFGLGKTRINLQLGKWIVKETGGRYLIVAPLGVRHEFTKNEGPAMGMRIDYVRNQDDIDASKSSYLITNYERVREGEIDVSQFSGASLDEASCLRSYGSLIYQNSLRWFKAVKYRFCFTATPSPNRFKELIHYGGFLGIMDTGEALTRFFQRDSSQANNLTLYPHMEAQFWLWLSSWAVFCQSPADLGHDATGYDMPKAKVHWVKVDVDHKKAWNQVDSWGQSQLLRDDAQGLSEGAAIKRESIESRVEVANQIIESQSKSKRWIIWHDLEAERDMIENMIPNVKTVYGSQDIEERESIVMDFTWGQGDWHFASKPSIAGSGTNLQRHCCDAIFLGVGYKFNDIIQSFHRIVRFGQKHIVNIYFIYLESESLIKDALQKKWKNHEILMEKMIAILKEHKLENIESMQLIKSLGCERAELKGELFQAVQNDCIIETAATPDNSIDMILTSIPFGTQYEYCPSFNDFGHNCGNEGFFKQMDFLIPQLLRVLKPGRIAAIHVKDRIRFGNVTGDGFPTNDPFSDETSTAFRKHGFRLLCRITIDTDVVRENNQTYRLGWSENAKDGTKMGAGQPEYILVFRKLPTDTSDGYADVPVVKSKDEYTRADWQIDAAGLWKSDGNRLLDPDIISFMGVKEAKELWEEHCLTGSYSYDKHVEICKELELKGSLPASFMLFPPVSRNKDIWTDIVRMSTLNSEQSRRNEEMHVCPLQLDVIKRLITRYSNAGELIYDPFAGIGSVPYQAIKMGRKGYGVELNAEYWRFMCGHCERIESELTAPTLFDLTKMELAKATSAY